MDAGSRSGLLMRGPEDRAAFFVSYFVLHSWGTDIGSYSANNSNERVLNLYGHLVIDSGILILEPKE